MTDVGAGIYKFTHRTFLEYFFSKYITKQNNTSAKLVGKLKAKISNAQWDVVNHLCVQSFCYKDPKKSGEVIDLLLSGMDKMSGDRLGNYVSFVARTLEYLSLSEVRTRTAAKKIIECSMRMAENGKAGGIFIIELLYSVPEERHVIVDAELLSAAAKSLREVTVRTKAMLEFIGSRFSRLFDGGRNYPAGVGRAKEALATRFRERLDSLAQHSLELSELAVRAEPEVFPLAHKAFGDAILMCTLRRQRDEIIVPILVEGMLSIAEGRRLGGAYARAQLLFAGLAEEFVGRVKRQELPLQIDARYRHALAFNDRGIIRHFGIEMNGSGMRSVASAIVVALCCEAASISDEREAMTPQAVLGGRGRRRRQVQNRMESSVAEPPSPPKFFKDWSEGAIKLIALA